MHHGNPYEKVMFEAVRELHREFMHNPDQTDQSQNVSLLRRLVNGLWQRKPIFNVEIEETNHSMTTQPVTSQE